MRTGAGKYIDQTQKWSNITSNKNSLKLNKFVTNASLQRSGWDSEIGADPTIL